MNYRSGWIDTSIEELVRGDPGLLSRYPFVLVTSLDSVTEAANSAVGERLRAWSPECAALGDGVVIPGDALAAAAATFPLFVGFDEIWCFDQRPVDAKPDGVSILPPPEFHSAAPPHPVLEWMRASGCPLALADGLGTNYVTADARFLPDAASTSLDPRAGG
jgi:hypothetical protein